MGQTKTLVLHFITCLSVSKEQQTSLEVSKLIFCNQNCLQIVLQIFDLPKQYSYISYLLISTQYKHKIILIKMFKSQSFLSVSLIFQLSKFCHNFISSLFFQGCNFLFYIIKQDREILNRTFTIEMLKMQKNSHLSPVYEPPFFLHKVQNYQKAVYERKGHWTEREKLKYGVFLQIFRQKFEDRKDPILNKMFRVMSDFIKTRNHNQCRSHHQKMEKERFQIDSILDSIKSKYHPREYEVFFEKYSRHIKAVNLDTVLNQKGFTPHKNVLKRRKVKVSISQVKIMREDPEVRCQQECQKISKVQNIEPISKVLNYGINGQKFDQNKIQFVKQKQNISEKQIFSNSKEEIAPKLIFANVKEPAENLIYEKDDKDIKKTGLDYEDDESNEPKKKIQKPKVAVFDIPPLQFPPPANPQQTIHPCYNMNSAMMPDFMNPSPHIRIPAQFLIHQLEPYPNFENQFPPSIYRTTQNEFNFEENFVVDMKSLEDKKKWHLSEATRLYVEMNQQLLKANNCDQMIEMMKKMKEMNDQTRGGYFYSNTYVNTQF